MVKAFPDKDGYLKYAFATREGTLNKFVHRLVYESFIGEIPKGMTVDHIDNNRLNNHYTNLQLLTPEENAIKGNARMWKVVSPDGEVLEVYNLQEFCRQNGLHKSHMYEVLHSKPSYHQHKGWTKYVEKSTTYRDGPRAVR